MAVIFGAALGVALGMVEHDEGPGGFFSQAWRRDADDTRTALGTLFGLQITVMTIVLAINSATLQAGANQFSPRLVPIHLKNSPLRGTVPVFAFSAAYTIGAVKVLGLVAEGIAKPRPVVSGAFLILLATFITLVSGMFKTFAMLRVERVLWLVQREAVEAAERVQSLVRNLTLAPAAKIVLPPTAVPLRARACGYIVEIDVAGLVARARRARVRVRISRAVGEYVDSDEIVGWVAPELAGGPVDQRAVRMLSQRIRFSQNRELDYDPIYGVRILADVATRSLGAFLSDPYTAQQALEQLRSVLRYVIKQPLGDQNIVDDDGLVRVSVNSADLREFISVGIEAPLRMGAGEPEVLDAVLEIAQEVGLLARERETRDLAHALVERVVQDATEYGHLDRSRRARLLAQADLVNETLARDAPRLDRHARAVWALMRKDEVDVIAARMAAVTP
ncbi:MAG: DUF2254 domain-containing protein [Polyangiaceae bacterium]|nr:DUF2254 domain-containing protein [Polyangiaceae bacterium]